MAARYVGCAGRRSAARRPATPSSPPGSRMANCNAEVGLLRYIRNAAKKEQYWRAAAWMLERGYPQRYARRGPDVITVEQIADLLAQFARS